MLLIRFLRPFASRRLVKGRFRLTASDGHSRYGFAFRPCSCQFTTGQEVAVRLLNGGTLVLHGNPLLGEVVLDNATEGKDFETVDLGQEAALPS